MRRKSEQLLRKRNHLTTILLPGLAMLSMTMASWGQSVGERDEFFRSVTDGTVEIVTSDLQQHPEWANAELFSGIRPLYRASVLGREEIVALLLAAGADVNATTDRGTLALHAASQNGHEKIFDRLLAAGAKVDEANDTGQTPLHLAVRFNHPLLVQKLLEAGASPNRADMMGRTPLHYAAGMGLLRPVELLLAKGSVLDPVDREGFTPLGWCRSLKRNDFEAVSTLLEKNGAPDLRPESAWVGPESPAAPGAGQEGTTEPSTDDKR